MILEALIALILSEIMTFLKLDKLIKMYWIIILMPFLFFFVLTISIFYP